MKINTRNPAHWVLLLKQFCYCLVGVIVRYFSGTSNTPVVILYGHQLSGNLKALYEEWLRTHSNDFDCYFLSLDPEYGEYLRREGVRVLSCSSPVDMVRVGRCNAVITDHGLHAMWFLTRLTSIIFIDVWHGIPFKGFVPGDFRLQHRYDEVWVSSPFLKEIYVQKFGFPEQIVHSLGYARTDRLFIAQQPDAAFREDNAIPAQNKIILYAPTWQQDQRGRDLFPFGQSQESFIEQLDNICRENSAILVVRCHLNASISMRVFDNVRYCSMKDYPDTEELLLQTDVLICDWSSIAFDFLALNRPTIFLDVEAPFKNGFTLGKDYRFGRIAGDMASLTRVIGETLMDQDSYFRDCSARHEIEIQKIYAENADGNSASRQIQRLASLMSQARSKRA